MRSSYRVFCVMAALSAFVLATGFGCGGPSSEQNINVKYTGKVGNAIVHKVGESDCPQFIGTVIISNDRSTAINIETPTAPDLDTTSEAGAVLEPGGSTRLEPGETVTYSIWYTCTGEQVAQHFTFRFTNDGGQSVSENRPWIGVEVID